ncbi:MAG: hypothetical protein LBE14_04105 [Treponema sp.]|jgi:hypothetical protein|nr:hypothetical protein [Treponema sp.]
MVTSLEPFKKWYAELLALIPENPGYDISAFFSQTGGKYYETKPKLLFVGKSANGWISDSTDIDELFDPQSESRFVNRPDEMTWLENPDAVYNPNKSAFWRVVKRVTQEFYGGEDWYPYIAWSNLYKLSPSDGGNAPPALLVRQQNICVKILNEELRALKPDAVIFLSSCWEQVFLKAMDMDFDQNKDLFWEGNVTSYQTKDGITYIQSAHPQGKPEDPHVSAVLSILKETVR